MTGDDTLRMLRQRAAERRQRLLANLFGRPSAIPSTRYLELTQQRVAAIDAALRQRKAESSYWARTWISDLGRH